MRIFSIDNENALYTQAAMHGGCFDLQKIVDDDKENLFPSFHNENSVDNENALCPQAAIHGGCFDVLLQEFGCILECFASPMNCRSPYILNPC